ncbi:MAG TPA: type II toxin-antitoxin system ParD family antitoxin [Iamia sp.]
MATTSFRLTPEDEAILDRAAERYGSRSEAFRAVLRELDAQEQRRQALKEFVEDWEAELGPADPAEVEAMRKHLGLK